MQYPITSVVIALAWLTKESQKTDEFPILATFQSGTSMMPSSYVKWSYYWKHSTV